jgi:hypothetical protein
MYTLRSIYGVDRKERHHAILSIHDKSILLYGGGPDAGLESLIQAVPCDAVVITSPCFQHASAFGALAGSNVTMYCPECMVDDFPADTARPLTRGRTEILGVSAFVGRSGREAGSCWLRFDCGDGLLFTPVPALDSGLYQADPPPKSGTIIISENLDQLGGARAGRIQMLSPQLANGNTVVFTTGLRDILDVLQTGIPSDFDQWPQIFLDETVKDDIEGLLHDPSAGLHAEAVDMLKTLQADSPFLFGNALPLNAVFMTSLKRRGGECADQGLSDTASGILQRYEKSNEPRFLFVGRVGDHPIAERLVYGGRAEVFPLPSGACPAACRDLLHMTEAERIMFFGRFENAATNVLSGLEHIEIVRDEASQGAPPDMLEGAPVSSLPGDSC